MPVKIRSGFFLFKLNHARVLDALPEPTRIW